MDSTKLNKWLVNTGLLFGLIATGYGGINSVLKLNAISDAKPDTNQAIQDIETKLREIISRNTTEVRAAIKDTERRLEVIDERVREIQISTARHGI